LKRKSTLVLATLCCGIFASCATIPRTSYLARVNQDVITMKDVKAEYKKRHGGHERYLFAGESELRRFLDAVIDQKLLTQEAYRIGLQDDPEIRKAVGNFETVAVIEHLVGKEVKEKSKATDEEIDTVYEWNLDEGVLARQIVVDSKEEAESIRKRIQAGEDFEAIAREKSISPSKIFGGLLPPLGWGAMDPEWEKVVFGLPPGEVSPVFKSAMGYEIVRLEEKRPLEKPVYTMAYGPIKSRIEQRKFAAHEKEFIRYLRGKYAVKITMPDLTLEELKKFEGRKPDPVLATWDNGSVTYSSLAARLDLKSLSSLPPETSRSMIKDALEEVINRETLTREAYARGYDNVPELSEKVTNLREDLMLKKLYDQYILVNITVNEADIKGYFEEHQSDFIVPEARHVAQILVDSLDTANEVMKKIQDGESFADLAKMYSKDAETKKRGGDLGWVERKNVPPAFEKIFSTLKPGEVDDPVKTDFGVHIIKLLEIRPPRPRDFPEVREEVEKKALHKKRADRVRSWVDQLKAVSRVEISDKGIRAALKDIDTAALNDKH